MEEPSPGEACCSDILRRGLAHRGLLLCLGITGGRARELVLLFSATALKKLQGRALLAPRCSPGTVCPPGTVCSGVDGVGWGQGCTCGPDAGCAHSREENVGRSSYLLPPSAPESCPCWKGR